jgi:hypothetical protein
MDPARPWSLEEELSVLSEASTSESEGAWIDCERPSPMVAGGSLPPTMNADLDIKLERGELARRQSFAATDFGSTDE